MRVEFTSGCLNPDGVAQRKQIRLHKRAYFSKGPNLKWHIDGYDKLTQIIVMFRIVIALYKHCPKGLIYV